jgi:hypothetical protein
MGVEINMNKTKVKKKFKRYLSHNAGTGRDTGHREMNISEEQMAVNWCQTFGHKFVDGRCQSCKLEENYTRRL